MNRLANHFFMCVILFITSNSHAHLNYQDRTVTLREDHISLRRALKLISEQTNIHFIYDDEVVERKVVSCHFAHEPLESCLQRLLDKLRIQFKRITSTTYILCINNQRKIYGHVYDAVTKAPLSMANVYVRGTSQGTAADQKGEFQLKIPADTEILTVRFMGYQLKEIYLLKSPDGMSIPMNPIAIPLQPIHVTATVNEEVDLRTNGSIVQNDQTLGLGTFANVFTESVSRLPAIRDDTEIIINPETKQKEIKSITAIDFSKITNSAPIPIQNKIRQGQFRDDLTLVDGIRIYEPYHIEIVPGTDASIISREMLNRASYFSGGFSADYGDALNSMSDIQYQDRVLKRFKGKVSLGIEGQDIYLSGGYPKRYSIMAHVRRNDNKYLPEFSQMERQIHPSFYDIQTKLNVFISPNHNAELYYLRTNDKCHFAPYMRTYHQPGSQNIYNINEPCINQIEESFWENTEYRSNVISVKSIHHFKNLILNNRVTYYEARLKDDSQIQRKITSNYSNRPDYFSRFEKDDHFTSKLSENIIEGEIVALRNQSESNWEKIGILFQLIKFSKNEMFHSPVTWETNTIKEIIAKPYEIRYPLQTIYYSFGDSTKLDLNMYKVNLYYLKRTRLFSNTFVNYGVRVKRSSLYDKYAINPRIRINCIITKKMLLNLAWGLYSQTPTIQQIQWHPSNYRNIKNQLASHYVASIDVNFSNNFSLKLETFYKKFNQLIPLSRLGDGSLFYLNKTNCKNGYARGIFLQTSYGHHHFNVKCAYMLSEAKETTIDEESYYPRYNDQRHALSGSISFQLWKQINLRINQYYGSGYAYTPYVLSSENDHEEWTQGEYHTAYFPRYYRTDLEIEKSFRMAHGSLQFSVRFINIFNRKNIFAYSYTYDELNHPIRNPQVLYGFIPLASLSYSF